MNRASLPLIASATVLLLALAALPLACSDDETTVISREAVLEHLALEVMVPAHTTLTTRAAALTAELDALCQTPTAAALESSRQAWRELRETWVTVEVFRFGPAKTRRSRAEIGFTPINVEEIEAIVAGDGALTPDDVHVLGASRKGSMTIEYLLFATPDDGDDVLATLEQAPRRCQLAHGAAGNLEDEARALEAAWSPTGEDFAGELVLAGQGSAAYPMQLDALKDVVNFMIFDVETSANMRLGAPMGMTTTGGTPDLEAIEGRHSETALDEIAMRVRTVERLYLGADGEHGLTALVSPRSPGVDARLRSELQAAIAALDAVPGSLEQALTANRAELQAAFDALKAVQVTLQADIAALLNVTLTFNDNDGD